MAWTYSDYESQATPALKLARLELHIAEVSAGAGGAAVAGDGRSRDPRAITEYLQFLKERRTELRRESGAKLLHARTQG